MRADTELVGAVVAEAADLGAEEHAVSKKIVAQAPDRIVGVEGGRVGWQGVDESPLGWIDPQIALHLEAGLGADHRIVRIVWPYAMVLIVGANLHREGAIVEDVAPAHQHIGGDESP